MIDRIAAAPISWGICEVPGWGLQMSPSRILGEMAELGISKWPSDTPVQLHYSAEDPFRNAAWIDDFQSSVNATGSPHDAYLDYPVTGHLNTDQTLPAEFDAESAKLTFERALDFVDRVGGVAPASA